LGVKLGKGLKKTLLARHNLTVALYKHMDFVIAKWGDPSVIALKKVGKLAKKLAGERSEAIRKAQISGELLEKKLDPAIGRFLDRAQELAAKQDTIRVSEWNAEVETMYKAMRAEGGLAPLDWHALRTMHRAMDSELERAVLSEAFPLAGRREVTDAVRRAKRHWSELMALTETAAAQPTSKITREFMQSGFKRTKVGFSKEVREEIEALGFAYVDNPKLLKNPAFVENIVELFGPDSKPLLLRAVLQRTFRSKTERLSGRVIAATGVKKAVRFVTRLAGKERRGEPKVKMGAVEVSLLDAKLAKAELGLGVAVEDAQFRMAPKALRELMSGSGINPSELRSFLNIAERVLAQTAPSPSQFLARRVILGGSLIGFATLGPAPSVEISLIAVGALWLTSKALGKLLSTPEGLRILIDGLRPNILRQQGIAFARRLHEALTKADVEQKEKPGVLGFVEEVAEQGVQFVGTGMEALAFASEARQRLAATARGKLPEAVQEFIPETKPGFKFPRLERELQSQRLSPSIPQ